MMKNKTRKKLPTLRPPYFVSSYMVDDFLEQSTLTVWHEKWIKKATARKQIEINGVSVYRNMGMGCCSKVTIVRWRLVEGEMKKNLSERLITVWYDCKQDFLMVFVFLGKKWNCRTNYWFLAVLEIIVSTAIRHSRQGIHLCPFCNEK